MLFNWSLFFKSWWLAWSQFKHPAGRLTPKRAGILLGMTLLYPLWQILIRAGYLLDALFYPQAARQPVQKPVFIVGNFRSGTTRLHRLIAADPQFTGMQLWEIYFAPSVTYRRIIQAFGRLDARLGGHLSRWLNRADNKLDETYQMHPTSLNGIEEDDLLGYHIWSTYLLLSFFPFRQVVEDYMYYDQRVPAARRRKDMRYYTQVIRRHLYAHPGHRYLSKSPTNTPKIETLAAAFPDAVFINIVRTPFETLPSTIKFFNTTWRLFADPLPQYVQQDLLLEQTQAWYRYPQEALSTLPPQRQMTVCYRDLIQHPGETIRRIYAHFGWTLSAEYAQILQAEEEKREHYRRDYTYSLDEVGLSEDILTKQFTPLLQNSPCPPSGHAREH